MANVKISQLPAGGALAGTEVLPVVQTGATVKVTVSSVANLFGSTITATSVNYSVQTTDATVLGSGTITLTLPTVSVPTGKAYRLKNSGNATVTASCSVNIDNQTTYTLSPRQSIDVQWDGTQYWIL